MLRVLTTFTGLSGLPGYCNMHFLGDDALGASQVRDRVVAFWTDLSSLLSDDVTYRVSPDVVNIDSASGEATEFFTVAPAAISGTNTDSALPLTSQLLCRLYTGEVRFGRRVRGRFNIPGLVEGANVNGGVEPTIVTNVGLELEDLIDSGGDNPLGVFSRPTVDSVGAPARAGAFTAALTGDVWTQWAVLRSRRD